MLNQITKLEIKLRDKAQNVSFNKHLVDRLELDELPELLYDKLRSSRSMSLNKRDQFQINC